MKIGIDFRTMTKGRRSGIEEYVYQITKALVERYPDHEFCLFYNALKKAKLDFPWLKLPNVKIFELYLPNRLIDLTGLTFGWPKIDHLLGGVDVFFSPHFFWASLSDCPRVITFHDLSFLRYPEFFPWQKQFWHARMLPRLQTRLAAHLIAVSNSTKKDLMSYFDVPEEKITVIYEGVDTNEFKPIPKDHPCLKEFRKREGLPERFFLFLGTIEPRKNVIAILQAFRYLLHSGMPKTIGLVLAGNVGWLSKNVLNLIFSKDLAENVYIRNVRSEERKFWYNSCEALIFPSFFEGFGLPPLEAMACGKPVITSNRSSIPEVVADAAIMVDPFRPEEIASAIKMIIEDRELCEELSSRAIERSAKFDWNKAAEQTFAILEKVR